MLKEKTLAVDFKHKEALSPVLPRPPLLSSHTSGWTGIHVQHHQQPTWETPEHCHTQHVIIINHAEHPDQIERLLGERQQVEQFCKGEIVIIPAGVRHKSISKGESDSTALILEPDSIAHIAYEAIDGEGMELVPHFAKPDPLIYQIGLSLHSEIKSNGLGSRLYVDSLITALSAHLIRHYCATQPNIPLYAGGLPRYQLKRAIAYINEHLDQDINLAEIAQAVGMSRYYFIRLFKQSMGVTPYKYLNQQRVEQAKRLLKQREIAIADIALRCGFANQSHFTKHFRQITGTTPKAYREH